MTDPITSPSISAPPFPLALLKAMRPKQWAKNVLVFVAPAAANAVVGRGDTGLVFHGRTAFQTLVAFVVFCMVASSTYLINDALDVESDRKHPTKRTRPIAAGWISVKVAVVCSVVLMGGGLAMALRLNWKFFVVVALYVAQTTSYSLYLKHEPVLDLVALSSGFILRLLGGAYAAEVPVSSWFFIISCFGSLYIATGKRMAEQRETAEGETVRKTLAIYTHDYLRYVQAVSGAIVVIGYVQWAFERSQTHPGSAVWSQVSILPFLVAILRYGLLVELGDGSAPEDLLSRDRQLQVVGLVWAVLVGIGFYVAS